MKKEQRRAFISGCTGQDGSFMADLLISKGYKVYGMIRRVTNRNYQNIQHLLNNENFELIQGDLGDQNSILRCLTISDPHEIFHFGAQSFVAESFKTPQNTANITGLGTLRVLEAMREYGNKDIRMFNASSSEIFGKMVESPANEYTPFYPRSPYGVAKVFAYYMTKNYRESYNMYCCSAISFNHESERRGKEFVTRKITSGIKQILQGKKDHIELGNLDARRDWGYAPCFCQAFLLMLQQDQPDDYIVATGQSHSIKQFLDVAFNYAGIDNWCKYVVINPIYYRPAEVQTLVGNSSKIRSIGWQYDMTFKQLVENMMKKELEK